MPPDSTSTLMSISRSLTSPDALRHYFWVLAVLSVIVLIVLALNKVDTLDALLGRPVGVPMKPPAELRQLHKEDDPSWA